MKKNKIVIANWKMNKTVSESQKFISELINNRKLKNYENVVICPSFLSIMSILKKCLKNNIKLGAQNCFYEDIGSFTGEVSPIMLKKAGIELSDLQKNLKNLGPEGQRAFTQLAGTIIQAETPIKRANGLLNEMWTTLKNSIRWQISSSAIHGFMSTISGAYNYAKDLNTSLNNIRIVSGESAENMATFAVEANKAAKALDATTVAYTDAALIYFQQGL